MSTQPATKNKFPIDLTPVQRATLKLYWHFAMIALFNAGLAALAYLDKFKTISWHAIIVSVIAQAVLALLDALKKFYSASGEPALSSLIDLASNEIAARTPPPVQLSSNEQAIAQAVSAAFSIPAKGMMPVQAAPTMQYPAIDPNTQTVTTLPNLAAINPSQHS